MKTRALLWVGLSWTCGLLWMAGAACGQRPVDDWTDITREQVDTSKLSPRALRLLDDPAFTWNHAQTEHFVLHFERKMFALKVARQAEFFYRSISEDLGSATDRFPVRSHIFVFRDEKDWKHFVQNYGIQTEWAFSLVAGLEMYLQQADNTSRSAEVLGHEMTHLVFNRFYPGRLPLWLNEGTAEWYGEFSYAAFKGIKKSKRQVFRRIREVYPVESLLLSTSYPANPTAVHAFYETSKFLVGFLQLQYPPEKFEPFLAAMAGGTPVAQALQDHYGIESIPAFSAAFHKFIR